MVLLSTSDYLKLLSIKLNVLYGLCEESPEDINLAIEYQRELNNYNFHELKMNDKEVLEHELAIKGSNPKLN